MFGLDLLSHWLLLSFRPQECRGGEGVDVGNNELHAKAFALSRDGRLHFLPQDGGHWLVHCIFVTAYSLAGNHCEVPLH